MSKADFLRVYKLQVLGDGAVGKSALTIQFVQSIWLDDYTPTIEDSYRKQCLVDDEDALIDILDTAGQEEYRAMRDQYIRDGEGFMLVYSITQRESFQEMTSVYDNILRVKDRDSVPAILVGNKCDLEFERRVAMSEGRERARSFGCSFLETSAKCRINVDQAFCDLVRAVRRHNRDFGRTQTNATHHDVVDSEGLIDYLPNCFSRCVVV